MRTWWFEKGTVWVLGGTAADDHTGFGKGRVPGEPSLSTCHIHAFRLANNAYALSRYSRGPESLPN